MATIPLHDQPSAGSAVRQEFLQGARDTFPLILGAIPFGLIFGSVAAENGLPLFIAMAMSLLVFAGSAQFVAVGLMAQGANWPVVLFTTTLVNLRHLIYSATLLPHLQKLGRPWQVALSFGLTDETFAVAVNRYQQPGCGENRHWYQAGSALFMYINWNLCTLAGFWAGHLWQNIGSLGLDFAMPATFIAMLVPYLKKRAILFPVLVTAGVSLAGHPLPHQFGLPVAVFCGLFTAVALERRRSGERGHG